MSVLFVVKGATKRKIVRRLRKIDRKKPVSTNLACDTDYSLNITLNTYMASLNKWILDIEVIYHLCSFRELLADFCAIESGIVVMKSDQYCCKNKDRNSSSHDSMK